MLKKVQIFEPDDKTCTKEAERCSMCKGSLTKRVLYVCESEHVVCEACRTPDASCHKLENGIALRSKLQTLKPVCIEITEVSHNDLASGDHGDNNKKALNSKSRSLCHVKCDKHLRNKRQTFSEEIIQGDHKETTIKYKNDNFCDSDSSISSQIVLKHSHTNESQRPVSCPVTECRKIITRDSILQHFYFDHSKVPRIALKESECHEVFIEPTSITERVTCNAVLLIKTDTLPHADSRTLMNGGYKNFSFLLMSARMPSAEIITTHGSEDSVPKRHVQTQTDAVKIRCSKVHMKSLSSTKSDDSIRVSKSYSNNDGDIMLWICKLGDSNYYYNISVSTTDMKLSSSITGESVNIRNSHDSQVIWDRFDHLHIREKNINKFTNKQNQLRITINIFHHE